jgi:hypothetical protein
VTITRHFKHSHWWKRWSWSKFATSHFALEGPTEGVCECKMDVKSTWIDSYMASNRSCLMVTRTVFKKPSLGRKPDTKLGDHDTPNAHNSWFVLFYHAWGPTWIEIHWDSIWLRVWSHMILHYTWGSVTTLDGFGVSWDNLWTLSFGLSQFHGHGSWLVCEMALRIFLFFLVTYVHMYLFALLPLV